MRRTMSSLLLALALFTAAAAPLLQTAPPAYADEWESGDGGEYSGEGE